jgi:hypothetical protein
MDVVYDRKGSGAGTDDVIDRHAYGINPYGVIFLSQLGEKHFRAYTLNLEIQEAAFSNGKNVSVWKLNHLSVTTETVRFPQNPQSLLGFGS